MTEALQQRQADRKGDYIGGETAGERQMRRARKRRERDPHGHGDETTDQRAVALRQHDIG